MTLMIAQCILIFGGQIERLTSLVFKLIAFKLSKA